jgi:CheY-like chemotaxis protein
MISEIVKILVIENNESYYKPAQSVFAKCGIDCTVYFSKSDTASLRILASKNYDIAFIDADIYKDLGSDLVNALQKRDPYISLIYVLDEPDPQFSKRVMAERASNCITKNFLVPDVLSVLINQCQIIRQTEITLQNMITENITANELNFLTEISYQIRTPLNSIIGFSSAMLETEKTEKGIIFLQAIKSSGEKIVQILDEKLGLQMDANNFVQENIKAPIKKIHFNEIVKMKILLVEDNVLNIKLIEHLFSEYGMNSDIALNGKLALELLEQKEYDLILMDIEMPDMNGYETTKHIREVLESNVPIIALTAHALPGEREKCLEMGMNEYISKPIDASKLFESIYETLRKSIASQMETVQEIGHVTNLQNLKETMHGRKAAIKEMLGYLLEQVPIYLKDLNEAVERTTYPDIAKLAHKIKSAILIMGAKHLEPLLNEIELKAKNNNDIDKIISLNNELNKSCKQAMKEVMEEKLKIE